MSLIANRPKTWNDVVGQEPVIRLLHSVLRTPRYMTKGYIFEGPYAVGKTSAAYLFAQALMCLGDDSLHCGKCPSCRTELAEHPGFTEVDAATYSGVNAMRELMSCIDGPATLGKRHVVIIDEAHRLSTEAWDVLLKPLELGDMSAVFLFVTSEGAKIPDTIRSRCAVTRFGAISIDALVGMLMKLADQEKIAYTQDGLKAVARHAKGRPRDAIKNLGLVAASGEVTLASAASALNQDAEAVALTIFQALLKDNLKSAVALAQELAQRIGLPKLVETLFSFMAEDVFSGATLSASFAPVRTMTDFFIKWSSVGTLSDEYVPMLIMELNELRHGVYQAPAVTLNTTMLGLVANQPPIAMKGAATPHILTADEMEKILED